MSAVSFLIPKINLANICSNIKANSIPKIWKKFKEKRKNRSGLKSIRQTYSVWLVKTKVFNQKIANKASSKKRNLKNRRKLKSRMNNNYQLPWNKVKSCWKEYNFWPRLTSRKIKHNPKNKNKSNRRLM